MSNNLTNKIFKSLEVSYFFRIYIETKIGDTLDNILPKDEVNKLDKSQLIKEYNNDSIITPDNWHEKKDILFKQHLETYKDSYTLEQKIKFEIEDLDKLATSERDYKVLVDNYKNFLLTKLQQPQTETKTPDAVLIKNQYPKIFKNDIGFTLFTKMYNYYKDEEKDNANFGFLFFAMEKDFLVCSQADFVKHLSNYNVHIDKIDNRQYHSDMNTNKKSKLYNATKQLLQKEHGLSTI